MYITVLVYRRARTCGKKRCSELAIKYNYVYYCNRQKQLPVANFVYQSRNQNLKL